MLRILTKPEDYLRTSKKDDVLAKLIKRKYPVAAMLLHSRTERYNAGVAKARKMDNVLIIAPENTEGVDTLTRDKKAFLRLYDRGYMDGHRVKPFLEIDEF